MEAIMKLNSPFASASADLPTTEATPYRIPVDLEVPTTWFPSVLDGERHRAMFAQLCTVLAAHPLDVHLKPVAHGMHHVVRRARPNGVVFSYHSIGTEPNVWRIKETPIAGWYSVDSNGFSGWSSLATFPAPHLARMQSLDPSISRAYVSHLREELQRKNVSKYSQSSEAFSVDRPYVYFPLQLIDDPVSEFCRLNPFDVLVKAAELAQMSGYPLVVKRHPLCRSREVAEVLHELQKAFPSVILSNASIHQHLDGCRSVIVANSGVGMEALMYAKPVFSFAASEYELATTPLASLEDLEGAFAAELPDNSVRAAQFLYYYLEQCCFSIYDTATVQRQVGRALSGITGVWAEPASNDLNLLQENERLRSALKNVQSENSNLRAVATQAVELATLLQQQSGDPSNSQVAAPNMGALAAVSKSLYGGALAASVGETVLAETIRSAYSAYAEMAITAMQAPELKDQVASEMLISGYAAGMDPALKHKNRSALDYQKLHDFDRGYQDNNWLVDHCDVVASTRPGLVIEIGCGNGRFLRKISSMVPNVIGLDWARSPQLSVVPNNVQFRTADVLKDEIPEGDVCVSADVLEHFEPNALPPLLSKLHKAARYNYHVIACYDDGHSHCSVFHPGQWLGLFKAISHEYRLVATITRPGRPDRIACVITNMPGTEKFFPKIGPLVGSWQTDTGQQITLFNNFSFSVGGNPAGAWFPMANGTGAMKWNSRDMVDLLSLGADGNTLGVQNMEGTNFSVRRIA